jgi:hypothetical protein
MYAKIRMDYAKLCKMVYDADVKLVGFCVRPTCLTKPVIVGRIDEKILWVIYSLSPLKCTIHY